MGGVLFSPLVDGYAASILWLRVIGAILFVIGGVVGIVGTLKLGDNRTPYPTPVAEVKLVRDGIYGYIRHPLYTCLIVLGFAWATIWMSGATLLFSVLLSLFLFAKARLEEQKLVVLFPGYREYQLSVPPFFPRRLR